MRTDTLFYQLLKTFRSLLFELTEQPIPNPEDYEFASVEVKEKAFRFDGIFLPQTLGQPIIFTEVQSQLKSNFYSALMAEICLYISQYEPEQDWQAVAIFARRSYDPGESRHFRELYASGRILRVYLEDWQERETDSWAIKIVQLIVASTAKTPQFVQKLKAEVEQEPLGELQEKIVEFIETVLVYKFPKFSREEIQAMFTLDDLRQTRVYQDAKQEGQVLLILRQLKRKFGFLDQELRSQVEQLSTTQLESLAEAILDFDRIENLETWLQNQS
jgi:predicted transposase/invertase (TIGR01784 family)